MAAQKSGIEEKIDGLATLFKAKFGDVEKHQDLIHSEITTLAKHNFDQDRKQNEDREKDQAGMAELGRVLAGIQGSRKTANKVFVTATGIFLALFSWGYHDIKTDISASTEIEAKKYIDETAKELEEGFLDSQDFKKKVISIVTDKFFE